jgi:3-hydroxyisobutyrate dehydrogenase-like beta-hydroxyacid dehydrogenase
MGSGFARALAEGGSRVVASVAGRSERTRRLAAASGVELLETLEEVAGSAEVILSIVPPGEAARAARAIGDAAGRAGRRPLVADLNAIAPASARAIETELAGLGLQLVDGSISGPPPRAGRETRVYLSGARAAEPAALGGSGISWLVVGGTVGAASAVKMSTASVYKGSVALLAQALLAAHENGVLEHVLGDLRRAWPELADGASAQLQSAAAKAGRYVGEMEEIASAQSAAGLTPALFEAVAEVYRGLAAAPLGSAELEDVDAGRPLAEVLEQLRDAERIP